MLQNPVLVSDTLRAESLMRGERRSATKCSPDDASRSLKSISRGGPSAARYGRNLPRQITRCVRYVERDQDHPS